MFIPERGRGENVSIAIQRSPSPRQYQYTCLNARTIQRWRSSKCLETVKTSIHFRMLDFHPSLGLWSKKRFWVDGFTDSRHWWSVQYADWCCPPLLGWAFSNNPLHMPHVQSIAWVVIFHSLVWKKNSSKLHQSSSYVIISSIISWLVFRVHISSMIGFLIQIFIYIYIYIIYSIHNI